ncbi:MAG: hypothetical protein ACJ76D_05060 [Solirubrobacterales bacterium]
MRRLVPLVCLALLACCCGTATATRLYTPTYFSEPPAAGGFDVNVDGSLTPLAGSPFGIVAGPPFEVGGIGNLAFAPDGRRAAVSFYFNGGVAGVSVAADGTLSPAGAPIPGPQQKGLAISPNGAFAYAAVANPASSEKGVFGYALGADGALTKLPGAPFGSEASQDIAISPDGRFLFAATGSGVQRFAIALDGSLTPLGFTPIPSAYYLQTAPQEPLLFAGSSFSSGTGVTGFAIGPDGSLSQRGETALTGDLSMGFFGVAPDGKHLYMPDSNLDGIVAAAVAPDGSVSAIGTMAAENPEMAAVSPDGRFLYWWRGQGASNHIAVASIGAEGIPTPLPFESKWDTGEEERLLFPPQSAGCPDHQVYTGQSTTCVAPAPASIPTAGGPKTGGDGKGANKSPVVSGVRVVPRQFAPATGGSKRGGTSFRYKVSEGAAVRFKIERKKGKRFKKLGSRPQLATKAGAYELSWNGKLHGRPLAPGPYRATVIAADKEGARSLPKTVGFRILPVPSSR